VLLNVHTQTLHRLVQLSLFSLVQIVLRVQNRRWHECLNAFQRVALNVCRRKNGGNFVTESFIVNQGHVVGHSVVSFEPVILLCSQHDLLAVQDAPELLVRQIALAKEVVILEVLLQSNTVLFDHAFNLMQQLFVLPYPCKVDLPVHISRLDTRSRSVDYVLEAVAILKEVGVADLSFFVAVDQPDL